jgi:endogenous inhibitor of DNA gyrase (YacG/DUF329 family)
LEKVSRETCPICKKPRGEFDLPEKHLPFCSERCKNADLARWLGGDYTVSRPLDSEDEIVVEEEPEDDRPEET